MIRALLFYRQDLTDARPGLMLACVGACILVAGALAKAMP
jgi:hypothetical protein